MTQTMARGADRSLLAWVLATILALAGLALLAGGAKLLLIGGSPYYLIAGVALIAAGWLTFRQQRSAAVLYALFLLSTWIWALWETGGNGWALVPRVGLFTALGLAFLIPAVVRHIGFPAQAKGAGKTLLATIGLAVAGMAALFVFQPGAPHGTSQLAAPWSNAAPTFWPAWGNNQGGERFADASQITARNVGALELAWTYETGAAPRAGGAQALAFEVTPLKIDETLYGCTPHSILFALDAATGREKWRSDPKTDDSNMAFANCRGVAYADLAVRGLVGATSPRPATAPQCTRRIYAGTVDARLIAVDADTGRPCPAFGSGGSVDLRRNLGEHEKSYFSYTSAPTVSGKVIVLGSFGLDGQILRQPSGVIRAYDLVTGRQVWDFDPAAPDRTAPMGDAEVYERGTPNSWSISSTDEALGLIYVPMGVATPDYYGGERTEPSERFSNTILAIDNKSGALRWSFQTVHHDIWDYDVASQPVLTDFPQGAGRVPTLISISKTGDMFVLDRRTGKPLSPIVERVVPASDVPDEKTSPTQPFSPGMPTLAGDRLKESEMWGLTPFDQLWCRIAFKDLRYEGRFTPPSVKGSLQYPGFAGGVNWGSYSIDRDRGILVVNSNRLPTRSRLITRDEATTLGMKPAGVGVTTTPEAVRAGVPQFGSRFAVLNGTLMSPLQVPCLQPPVGELTAIDLATRRVLWKKPIGTADRMGPLGFASHLPLAFGLPSVGGSLTTKSGVIFIASTPDRRLQAYDIHTGRLLWRGDLPANGNANPMTYVARDGRQYVVIAAGGSGALATNEKNILVAFALPRPANNQ